MSKPDLLLLHGALGAKTQLAPLVAELEGQFEVLTLDFSGHGAAPLPHAVFATEHFADDVLGYLDAKGLDAANLWGYSMGGYVALYLARHFPARVRRVCTLATKFTWTPEGAAREVRFLNPDVIEEKIPYFARALAARHTALGWRTVMAHTREMMLALGERPALQTADLAQIEQPVRIGVGDIDTMVGLEESIGVYRALPQGELEVYPATPHPLEKVSFSRIAHAIGDFFT